ncbi:hypothetical protein RRG08_017313 [Elysia crispata]|uniref:Uncharacterized protein n=1 Tax=Elysia crispata TaxID=231223 RepID=A0AAE0YSP9_9GAST|nr:hypothetical protein RRG08_017313 [Elysia crispata]
MECELPADAGECNLIMVPNPTPMMRLCFDTAVMNGFHLSWEWVHTKGRSHTAHMRELIIGAHENKATTHPFHSLPSLRLHLPEFSSGKTQV